MAGNTYVSKGYSTYTYIPDLQGGYDHGPQNPINQYAVESKTSAMVSGRPAIGYTDYVGSPSKIDVHSLAMSSSPNAVHRTTDELSTHAQSLEPQKRYGRPTFVAKPHDIYKKRHWWL
ncbi:hypothetical protein L2E82_08813 [Cichorium intybus]|uniref:Uncharacterized protein n=1 Tax=Cichorium intybus TaxID=13427 RepID=A0ACB9G715_CICIN|nr:hypothetical protein L2E82_08813 [Cichorium intybus]